MALKRIVIITDGSVAMGLGHVYRSIALAKLLRDQAEVTFLTASEAAVQATIQDSGFEVLHADGPYEPHLKDLPKPDVIVVDKLAVEETLAMRVKRTPGMRLAIFGNVSAANRHADVVVNAIIGTKFRNSRRLDPETGTLYLEGPRFVVLREEFYARRGTYRHKGALERVLLIFGGTDPSNLTCRAVKLLLTSGLQCRVTACVGGLFSHLDELDRLRDWAMSRAHTLEVVRDSAAVSELMTAHDFVVTSPGNALFEAFSLGVPALAFCQNPSQHAIFKEFYKTYEQCALDSLPELMHSAYYGYPEYRAAVDAMEVGAGRAEIASAILRN
jgi:spore coat polysaccharide biosynthesis predicted glycosyltransferase SpsG